MGRRIVAAAGRPESWLGLLLAWTLLSALRSWHTPWARVAATEALRSSAGVALTLALGMGLRRLRLAAESLTILLAALVLGVLVNGLSPSDMVTGPFQDHQLCASALLVLLPFAVALALAADTPAWRWAAQAISVAAAVCLAVTQTRSAWIGAGVAALLCAALWLGLNSSRSSRRRRRAWILPILVVLGVAGGAGLLTSATDLGAPLAARARTMQAVGRDKSWQGRVQAWQGAVQMIAARPIAGWGLGRYPGAQWRWTRQGRPLSPAQRPSLSEQAHDFYLQMAAETGLIGLALYLAALGTLLTRGLQALRAAGLRRRGLTRALLIATVSLIAGQAVDALASPSYQFGEVSLLFWAGLGVGLAALHRQGAAEEPSVLPPRLRGVVRLGTAGLAAVALAAQIVPLDLLTPVEAYTLPSGWTLSSLSVAGSTNSVTLPSNYSTGNTSVIYTMTAVFQSTDGGGHTQYSPPMTFTNTSDCSYNASGTQAVFSSFGTASRVNILSLNRSDRPASGSRVLTITAKLKDTNNNNSVIGTATTALTIVAGS